jgi:hypothetical protein
MIFISHGVLSERKLTDFPSSAVRSYDDLITAIRAVKEFLGLSNEVIEDLSGLTRGHFDKVAGRTPVKRMGPMVLDALLGALAIELVVRPDPAAAEKIANRWRCRREDHVRTCQPVSRALLDRCRPIILAELGHAGGIASARARRRERRNGHNAAG